MTKKKKKKGLSVRKRKKKAKSKKMGKSLIAKDGTKRTVAGKFPKGVCGNPKGRPKGSGSKYSATDLQVAIEAVEKKKDETFLEVWIEAAWGSAADMANVASFMLPKLRAIEQINIAADSASDEEAEKWRREMYERFHPA